MTAGRFSTDVYAQRLSSAASAAAEAGLAGLVITPGYDLRYLVGSAVLGSTSAVRRSNVCAREPTR